MYKQEKIGTQFRARGIEIKEKELSQLGCLLHKKHQLSIESYQSGYARRRICARIRSLHLDSLSDHLDKGEQLRLLKNFDRALGQGGYLVLGKTEFLLEPYRSGFEHISVSERIYQNPVLSITLKKAGGKL